MYNVYDGNTGIFYVQQLDVSIVIHWWKDIRWDNQRKNKHAVHAVGYIRKSSPLDNVIPPESALLYIVTLYSRWLPPRSTVHIAGLSGVLGWAQYWFPTPSLSSSPSTALSAVRSAQTPVWTADLLYAMLPGIYSTLNRHWSFRWLRLLGPHTVVR